ncbi:MAG: rRNA (uracil1939-C5)-methyltransferase [Pyrinomonadaceae bacterium]|jgi:23S rRNA (uracil1939-C5)-methyltransferase|nr:rRNA (uracil1939-C5)-methyltransferase [Pyrinomonadaceae bacterium]
MKKQHRRPRRESPPTAAEGKLSAGALVEVEIERIVPGGAGLGHADGYTLFVQLAAPGDRVRARVERVRGKVAFASVVEVITPSPVRVEPPCPYFGRCGGCDFQQLTYEAQLAAKVEIIRDCLRRIARVEPPARIPITPSPAVWRYRSRARWQHDPVRQFLGYYELASHRVCDVTECPVVLPEVQDKLSHLRATLAAGGDFDETEEFQAVAGDDGVSLLPPLDASDARERFRDLAGERYHFDADCFFQINHALLEPLLAEALKGTPTEPDTTGEPDTMGESDVTGESGMTGNTAAMGGESNALGSESNATGEMAVDLYCGVGLFTLPLARRFARVAAIEGNASATGFARRNLAAAGLTNASVHTARVGEWLAAHAPSLTPVAFLLLDPPRAGAEPEALHGILLLRPRRIAYVSCDPATLARDLRALFDAGYTLDSIRAFDLFPQTHHVETVVHLTASATTNRSQ